MASKVQSTPTGEAAWINVIDLQTNKFDPTKKEWTLGLKLEDKLSEQVFEKIEDLLTARRESDSKFPKNNSSLTLPFGPAMEKDDDGNKTPIEGFVMFKFKRSGYRTIRGEQVANTAPRVLDSMGRDIPKDAGIDIGWGSQVKVFYEPYIYDRGRTGVGLELKGVQIIVLKERAPEIQAEAVEGGWTFNDGLVDPFDVAS